MSQLFIHIFLRIDLLGIWVELLDLFKFINRVTEDAAHPLCLGSLQLRAELARVGKCCGGELPAKLRELGELLLVGEGDGDAEVVESLEGLLVR